VLASGGNASLLQPRQRQELLPPAELTDARGSAALGASALTAAELRLLPLLATHLSFPEIAAQLYLSRNTVKSHTNSIYRKLGTSSRSQAVSRLRDLGLLEA
jgi:DNA-binding CsgD family transcriptional regulator